MLGLHLRLSLTVTRWQQGAIRLLWSPREQRAPLYHQQKAKPPQKTPPGTSKAPPASKPKSSNPFNQNIGGKNYKLRQKRLGKVQIVVTPDGATKPSEGYRC